jgi:O-antigen/teichoic acid export membrane protein
VGRGTAVVDQAVSGLSNVLAVALVARAVDAADFGRFMLAYATLTVTLTLSRSLLATRISLAPSRQEARRLTAELVAAVAWLSPVLVLVVFGIAAAVAGGRSVGIVLIVALATPLVCMQDLLRFGAVAADRPGSALASDATWLAVVAVPVLLGLSLSPQAALGLWAAGASCGLLVGLLTCGVRPRLGVGLAQLRRRDAIGESVTVGAVVTSAASLLVLFVVARALGPTPAGSLRGAATAMAPVNVLLAFVTLGLAPALVRRRREDDVRFCAAVLLVLGAAAAGWGAVLLVVPDSVGTAAFGESWDGIERVLPWTVVEYLALSVGAAGALGLKVRQRGRDMVRQRVVYSGVMLSGGVGGALLGRDVLGVAAMLALAAAVLAALAWMQFLRSPARPAPAVPA